GRAARWRGDGAGHRGDGRVCDPGGAVPGFARAGTRRPGASARPVVHRFHLRTRRRTRSARRAATRRHRHLAAGPPAITRWDDTGRMPAGTGSHRNVPALLFRGPSGARRRTALEGAGIKQRIATLDDACARINPILMLVAAAIALLDFAVAGHRLGAVHPAAP